MLRRLNDLKQGQQMNDLAARFKPDTAPVLHNRAWFQHTQLRKADMERPRLTLFRFDDMIAKMKQ